MSVPSPLPPELGGPPAKRPVVDSEEYDRLQLALTSVLTVDRTVGRKDGYSYRNCLPFYGSLLVGSVLHVGKAAAAIASTACVWLDSSGVLHLAFNPYFLDELERYEFRYLDASDREGAERLRQGKDGGRPWVVVPDTELPSSIRAYRDRADAENVLETADAWVSPPPGPHQVAFRADYSRIVAVCVHELLHVAYLHLLSDREGLDARVANLAMDTSINQYIDDLPDMAVTLQTWADRGLVLEPNREWEYYYLQILEKQKDEQKEGKKKKKSEGAPSAPASRGGPRGRGGRGGGGGRRRGEGGGGDRDREGSQGAEGDPGSAGLPGTLDDHEPWRTPDKIDEVVNKQFSGRFREEAQKSGLWGSLPGDIVRAIDKFLTPKVSWKPLLRRFIGDAIRIAVEKTRKRPSRRMGWDAPGRKVVRSGTLWVAVDNSGSVGEAEAAQFFGEIGSFVDQIEVILLVWDTAIRSVRKIDRRGDLFQAARNLGGGGGTDVSCVFRALTQPSSIENPRARSILSGRPNGLVVLTDGDLSWPEAEGNNVVPTLWGITQERNLTAPKFGRPLHVRVG